MKFPFWSSIVEFEEDSAVTYLRYSLPVLPEHKCEWGVWVRRQRGPGGSYRGLSGQDEHTKDDWTGPTTSTGHSLPLAYANYAQQVMT